MLTLKHPSYSLLEAQRRLTIAGCYAAMGSGAVVWMKFAPPALAGIAGMVAVAAGYVVVKRLRDAMPFWTGHQGEEAVQRALMRLGPEYICMTNYMVPSARPGDVDLVLLGPFGVLVLEVKTVMQPIRCLGDRWSVLRATGSWKSIKSYSEQCKRNVKKLERLVGAPVTGTLVFGDHVPLQSHEATVKILRKKDLVRFVQSLPDAGLDAQELRETLRQAEKASVK